MRWKVSLAAALLGLVAYGFGVFTGASDPGSTVGMGLGIVAAVLLALVMLYSLRRSMPAVRWLGAPRRYLGLHLYGGSLFFLFFVLHTDFGLPSGWLTGSLWAVSLWVVLTGAVGGVFQRWLPKLLDDVSGFEVHFERIPELVEDLRGRAEQVAQEADSRVRAFYQREMAPDMAAVRSPLAVRAGRTVAQTLKSHEMDILRQTLDAGGVEAVESLEEMHEAKLDLDRHYWIQSLLRGWLRWHLPVGIVLLVLVGLHVFFVLYY